MTLTTTDIALQTGSGQFGFVLAIEGFPYLLTDARQTAAVVTAWAGTGWTQALPGLAVVGGAKQSIEPLKPDLDIPDLTFRVLDYDGSDVFGKVVWKNRPTVSSRLDDVFAPNVDGSGTVTVRSNSGFAASGVGYLGTKAVGYSGKVGTTELTIDPAGASLYNPLSADGTNTYSWPNRTATGAGFDIAAPPRFSDVPPTWIGRKVALYIHRIYGGVWDSKGAAHLEFAGKIAKVTDGEPGIVTVQCRDLRADIESAVLLHDQWVGYVKPGIQLVAGEKLRVRTYNENTYATTISGEFEVVVSGAASSAEIDQGLYDYDEFLERVTAWLVDEASEFDGWTAAMRGTDLGQRTVIRAGSYASYAPRKLFIESNSAHMMTFMGFPEPVQEDGWLVGASVGSGYSYPAIISPNAPYRAMALQNKRSGSRATRPIDLDLTEGSWFAYGEDFGPDILRGQIGTTDQSYVRIGESQLAIAIYDSAFPLQLSEVYPVIGYGQLYQDGDVFTPPGITYDDDAELLEVRQVVVMTGKFSELIPRVIASIDGRGVNHATYDAFPWGAAVPWSVLGDAFLRSCEALEDDGETDTITVLLDKPTPLKDILVPELALRFAFLVFKEGVYQFVCPPTPNAYEAEFTLDETNKAIGGGSQMPPSRTEWTSESLVNVIKINHSKDASGKFVGKPYIVRDQVSIDMHGESQVMTIDAVNSMDSENTGVSGSTVEHLAANLATRLFPMFGHPVKVVTRPLAPSMFHIYPGAIVSLSDDLVRDSTTGARGVVSRACICLSVFHDYGHEGGQLAGEVTLLLSNEDRTYPLSPAAEVDTAYGTAPYTTGYDGAGFQLKLKAHSFSPATADADVTNFEAGDAVHIVEIDPANPAAADSWERTIATVGADSIALTASLAAPAWGGATKRYGVIPQRYASTQASQKLHAFQADDADGEVQNVAEPNNYGSSFSVRQYTADLTELPSLIAESTYGDGRPVTPLHVRTMDRMVNNLVNYKAATQAPVLPAAPMICSALDYEVMLTFLFHIGGSPLAGRYRRIAVAPQLHVTAGGVANTGTVKIVSSRLPPSGLTRGAYTFNGPTRSVTFSTSSVTKVIPTAQYLLPVPANVPGYTWLTVLGKRTLASYYLYIDAIPTLYLMPLTTS